MNLCRRLLELSRIRLWASVILAGILVSCGQQPIEDERWDVAIELAVQDVLPGHIEVRVNWLGESMHLTLVDEGGAGDRIPGDGIYTAMFQGPSVRYIGVTFARNEEGVMYEGYRSVERVPVGGGVLSYGLANHNNLTVQRLSSSGTEKSVEVKEMARTGFGVLWSWFCLLVALSLISSHTSTKPKPHHAAWPSWLLPAIWTLLATAWTWPALIGGAVHSVGAHFDSFGTIWSISATPRLMPDMFDSLTAWPIGADHRAFDSFSILPAAYLLKSIDPVKVHALLGLFGVAASAWAAELFAHRLGARRPWSMIAGLTFGFSGLAATALLEGHVYHVMNPWLPLFGLYWWQACGAKGTIKDGLLSGVFFVLTLLTTAYLGVAASIIAGGFFVGSLARREMQARVAASALVVVAPFVYAVLLGISANSVGGESIHRIILGSAQFGNLGIPTPEIDRAGHSVAAGLGGLSFALAFLAPVILRGGRWRTLYWTAGFALLMAFGPVLGIDPDTQILPLPTYPLWDLPVLGQLRFPIRLLWAWLLCSGVLASLAASELASHPRARFLLILAFVHAFLFVALPFRQVMNLATTPSAYSGAPEGAILELMSSGADPSGEYDNWTSATSCLYQTDHMRPISEDCVGLPVQKNPRMKIQQWVEDRLREGDAETVKEGLESMGFGAIAWHPDLYSRGDRKRMQFALRNWPSPTVSMDGGERIWLYPLAAVAEPVQTLPTDTPSTTLGVGTLKPKTAQHVFVELQVPFDSADQAPDESSRVQDWTQVAYSIDYTVKGQTRSAPLTNDGTKAGDWQDDYIWTALIHGPLPHLLPMSIVAQFDQKAVVLWAGQVAVDGDNDRIAFLRSGDKARPVNASADRPNPPARRGAGAVAVMGWAGWIIILGLWHLKRRQQRHSSRV